MPPSHDRITPIPTAFPVLNRTKFPQKDDLFAENCDELPAQSTIYPFPIHRTSKPWSCSAPPPEPNRTTDASFDPSRLDCRIHTAGPIAGGDCCCQQVMHADSQLFRQQCAVHHPPPAW